MNFYNLKIIKQHSRINCPECSILLTPYSCQDVIVDRCNNCGGIWFDKKEIGFFRDSLKDLPIENVKVDKALSSDTYVIRC